MKLPFHVVEVRGDILFAARGASIHSFNLTDGSHISCSWKFPAAEASKKVALRKEDQLVINVSENSTPAPSQDEQGPPAKRVKLDGGEAVAAAAAAEASEKTTEVKPTPTEDSQAKEETPNLRGGGGGKKNKKQGPRPGPLSQATERPMVILMTVTQDGHYVVAVTSEKSIWVLEHDGKGQLKQLSRRYVDPLRIHACGLSKGRWPFTCLKVYSRALFSSYGTNSVINAIQCICNDLETNLYSQNITEQCQNAPAP